MVDRSKKLTRQLKRYLGFKDAEQIISESASLNSNDISLDQAPSDIEKIIGAVPAFLDAIDNSYAEYEDRLKMATRNIEISSKELTDAYTNLEGLNANINAMLDSLGQGLLFFDKDGICSPTFSKSCLRLLGAEPAGRPIYHVLQCSSEKEKNFHSWLKITFSGMGALDFDDMKSLLPQEIKNYDGLEIELDYKPMYAPNSDIMGVLLIATDVTYKREVEQKLHETQNEAQKILQISKNKQNFQSFINEISIFISESENTQTETLSPKLKSSIQRDLHTFKGSSATFHIDKLTHALHSLESYLSSCADNVPFSRFVHRMSDLKDILEQERNEIMDIFGADFFYQAQEKLIPANKIERLMDFIFDSIQNDDDRTIIKKYIDEELFSTPIFDLFNPFKSELMRVCALEGKNAPEFIFEGENVPVVAEKYSTFFNVIPHLARNIADHGLETPQERSNKNKSQTGTVKIRVTRGIGADRRSALKFHISDDGRGINPESIRKHLYDHGRIEASKESDDDIIDHIMDADFSLKEEINLTSGRGIGMNAIKHALKNMDGHIQVKSDFKNSTGTTFILSIPFIG